MVSTLGLLGFEAERRYSGTLSPYYTDSHRRLAEYMRKYVTEDLAPYAAEWDEAEEIPTEVHFPMALSKVCRSTNDTPIRDV